MEQLRHFGDGHILSLAREAAELLVVHDGEQGAALRQHGGDHHQVARGHRQAAVTKAPSDRQGMNNPGDAGEPGARQLPLCHNPGGFDQGRAGANVRR